MSTNTLPEHCELLPSISLYATYELLSCIRGLYCCLFFVLFLFFIFFDIDFLLKLDIHRVLTWWPVTLGLPHFELEKKKRIFVPSTLGKHYGIHWAWTDLGHTRSRFASGIVDLVRACALSLELWQLSSNLMGPQTEIKGIKIWGRK